MNGSKKPCEDTIRHRLLEGMLLRLARLPDADHFILRGGMLMRLWFRPYDRPAADLDLVSTFPFCVEETARRFLPVLADRGVDDGVKFDTERFRMEGIWQNTDFPGRAAVRLRRGRGDRGRFQRGHDLRRAADPGAGAERVSDAGLRADARSLWMCRPETITGRKLHALLHMGMLHWRPKDLNDLRLLLGRVPMNLDDLPEAIAASFTSRGNTTSGSPLAFCAATGGP